MLNFPFRITELGPHLAVNEVMKVFSPHTYRRVWTEPVYETVTEVQDLTHFERVREPDIVANLGWVFSALATTLAGVQLEDVSEESDYARYGIAAGLGVAGLSMLIESLLDSN